MSVRSALPEDMDTIGELFEEFRLAHQPDVPYDPDHFLGYVRKGLDDPSCLALLLDDDKGLLLAAITQSIYAPQKLAKEIVWYTRPDARGRGMALFRAFGLWAGMMGADHVHCTLQRPSPAMARMGFTLTEVGYIRPAPEVMPAAAE